MKIQTQPPRLKRPAADQRRRAADIEAVMLGGVT
jgi:hypothetical protein